MLLGNIGTMTQEENIQAYARSIAQEFNPEQIILFGSHARGDASSDSDVDLLVILPRHGKERHEQTAEIYRRCHSNFPVDVIVRTRNEFQESQSKNDWFMQDIAREGKILHEA